MSDGPSPTGSPDRPGGPPPGWYTDPYDARQQRYWDGRAWTGHTSPVAGQPGAAWAQPGAPGTPTAGAGGAGGAYVDPWLWQSILATLFCCLPLGIVGVVNASQASTALSMGDYAGAAYKADLAKKFTLISVALLPLFFFGWLTLMLLGFVTGL